MVQRRSYRKKRQRRLTIIKSICAVLSVGAISTAIYFGVQGKPLKDAYDFNQRIPAISLKSEFDKADTFSKNLCVIIDESQFADANMTATSAALFNRTNNQVLYSKSGYERIYPASMTKVLTALIVLKYGNMDDIVRVNEESIITESGATLAGIKPGDVLTMKDLFYGLMIPSGNDAGNAIAVHISGSVEKFAELMTKEAKALGATQSNFTNPHGLHNENHYTTAYDLYLIFNEAIRYEEFLTVISAPAYEVNYKDANGAPLKQTWTIGNQYMNGKLPTPEGVAVMGGKTGTTNAAGNCLVMLSKNAAEEEFISIVIKAEGRDSLYFQMTNLLNKIAN